ncbi:DDE-type integrase/transposase/recombinase [Deinococcus hopiensis]|uniref:DDE-type integrase/transposase/recombinase n=1 Tax=Deinococcus hopiensis TaxID=309885 RepID=UPI003CCC2C7A
MASVLGEGGAEPSGGDSGAPRSRCRYRFCGEAVSPPHPGLPGPRRTSVGTGHGRHCESVPTGRMKFSCLVARDRRRRGSREHLDEMCVDVGGTRRWLWQAVYEHGTVLDGFVVSTPGYEASKTFFVRLLGEYDVAGCGCGRKRPSAAWAFPSLTAAQAQADPLGPRSVPHGGAD